MFRLTVYKTPTGNFEDFNQVEVKQFYTLKQAETYADMKYDLAPTGGKFQGEYTNSGNTIGTIERF